MISDSFCSLACSLFSSYLVTTGFPFRVSVMPSGADLHYLLLTVIIFFSFLAAVFWGTAAGVLFQVSPFSSYTCGNPTSSFPSQWQPYVGDCSRIVALKGLTWALCTCSFLLSVTLSQLMYNIQGACLLLCFSPPLPTCSPSIGAKTLVCMVPAAPPFNHHLVILHPNVQ